MKTGRIRAGRCALLAAAAVLTLTAAVFVRRHPPAEDPRYPGCLVRRATGLYCPGCGATRAVHELLHLRPVQAMDLNALAVFAAPVLGAGAIIAGWRWGRGLPPLRHVRWRRLCWSALAVIVIFTVLRNLPFEPFVRLAP